MILTTFKTKDPCFLTNLLDYFFFIIIILLCLWVHQSIRHKPQQPTDTENQRKEKHLFSAIIGPSWNLVINCDEGLNILTPPHFLSLLLSLLLLIGFHFCLLGFPLFFSRVMCSWFIAPHFASINQSCQVKTHFTLLFSKILNCSRDLWEMADKYDWCNYKSWCCSWNCGFLKPCAFLFKYLLWSHIF